MKTNTAQDFIAFTKTKLFESIPRVSTIIDQHSKQFLYAWYGKVGNAEAKRISEESKEIGSLSHTIFENIIDGVPFELSDERLAVPSANFKLFLKALKSYKDVVGEQVVYHPKYKYRGTLDRVMYINGKLTLLDWKTSNQINDDYIMQVNAYYQALTEMEKDGKIVLPGKIEQVGIVRLDKKKEFDYDKDVVFQKPNKKAFKAFLGLLDYYNNKDFNKKEK